MFKRIISTIILAGVLGACASTGALDRANSASVSGDAFSRALHQGYIKIAHDEWYEGDWGDLNYFTEKALSVAASGDVEPDGFSQRNIPRRHQSELQAARQRLVDARAGHGRELAPQALARAQVRFECWMQEQEENFQPDDIAACRSGFLSAISDVETGMRRAQVPLPVSAPPETFVAPMLPQVHGTPVPLEPHMRVSDYTIYFDFDSARLDDSARRVMAEILAAIDSVGEADFRMDGHADRAGPRDYNMALSAQRIEAVVSFLVASGVRRSSIHVEAYGEENPLVATDDGVRESRNRRVHVRVE
jgi:OmpA-OmpF porin, OOP family